MPDPAPQPEPLLEVEEIQGNILAGFNKDHQLLIGLQIRDVEAARRWLERIEPEIATTAEVLEFNRLFKRLRARRGVDPAGLVATWTNIAFSAEGLRKLTSPEVVEQIPSGSFRDGMLAVAANLHDPFHGPGSPETWTVGGPGREAEILLIIASDDPAQLQATDLRLCPVDREPGAPEVIWREEGATRPDAPGHEHFGFKDGISQPAVRGLVSLDPETYLTPRLLDPAGPLAQNFSQPGDQLVWPGHFVLGYATQSNQDGSLVEPFPFEPAWLKNGSFLVFRRLLQDVHAFREDVQGLATAHGLSPELLAARMVGRWPSGAPLVRSPEGEDSSIGGDGALNNYFGYGAAVPEAHFRPELGRPPAAGAPADPHGQRCPLGAHIRKVNPRDQDSDLGDPNDTRARLMLRRGIPFGPSLPASATRDDGALRGLHFLAYQGSLEFQFETVVTDWVNHRANPHGAGGYDALIGQEEDEAGDRSRFFETRGADGQMVKLPLPRQWVTTGGGGYFFAPALSALRGPLIRG